MPKRRKAAKAWQAVGEINAVGVDIYIDINQERHSRCIALTMTPPQFSKDSAWALRTIMTRGVAEALKNLLEEADSRR